MDKIFKLGTEHIIDNYSYGNYPKGIIETIQVIEVNDEYYVFRNVCTRKINTIYKEDLAKIKLLKTFDTKEQEIIPKQLTNNIRTILGRFELIDEVKSNNIKNTKKLNLISIIDPKRDYLPDDVVLKFKNNIALQFYDIEYNLGNYTHISKAQAKDILDFILNGLNKNEEFIIHCEAGVSRSSAIGLVIELISSEFSKEEIRDFYLNKSIEDEDFLRNKFFRNSNILNHFRYEPNRLVFKYILEEYIF